MFRRALFYYNERSWRSFSNVLTEKLLQASNQVAVLCDKGPHVVPKKLEKHISRLIFEHWRMVLRLDAPKKFQQVFLSNGNLWARTSCLKQVFEKIEKLVLEGGYDLPEWLQSAVSAVLYVN